MSRHYQRLDAPHFDYQLEQIAQLPGETLRGPIAALGYDAAVCIGAAQTFGRFVERPFPAILQQELDAPFINCGLGGVGPRFWLRPDLVTVLNKTRLVVVQVMSGRSASNHLFDNATRGDLEGTLIESGERMRFEEFLTRLINTADRAEIQRVVQRTREDYARSMRQLGAALNVPTVLLWLSRRPPRYTPKWDSASGVMNTFPQLIDDAVVDDIRGSFDDYVECISDEGIPQRLWRASNSVDGAEMGDDGFLYNNYYPSPEMHALAAEMLTPACLRVTGG